jgi:hypothetical protein
MTSGRAPIDRKYGKLGFRLAVDYHNRICCELDCHRYINFGLLLNLLDKATRSGLSAYTTTVSSLVGSLCC